MSKPFLLDLIDILTNRDNFPNFENIVSVDLWSGNISKVPSRINSSLLFENTRRVLLLKKQNCFVSERPKMTHNCNSSRSCALLWEQQLFSRSRGQLFQMVDVSFWTAALFSIGAHRS